MRRATFGDFADGIYRAKRSTRRVYVMVMFDILFNGNTVRPRARQCSELALSRFAARPPARPPAAWNRARTHHVAPRITATFVQRPRPSRKPFVHGAQSDHRERRVTNGEKRCGFRNASSPCIRVSYAATSVIIVTVASRTQRSGGVVNYKHSREPRVYRVRFFIRFYRTLCASSTRHSILG